MSKVYREIGGGPVPGHSGPVAQLLQAVAPPAVAVVQLRPEVAPPPVVGQAARVLQSAASHGSVGAQGGAAPPARAMVEPLAMSSVTWAHNLSDRMQFA